MATKTQRHAHLVSNEALNLGLKELAWSIMTSKKYDPMAELPTRYFVLKLIYEYIISSFRLNQNPLVHLREVFKAFDWKYLDVRAHSENERERLIMDFIGNSDFFWVADSHIWVSATTNNLCEAPDSSFLMLPGSTTEVLHEFRKGEGPLSLYMRSRVKRAVDLEVAY
jgi:hypothetical protein